MILSDKAILREMLTGNIVISPWERKHLGSNSYDVHLASTLGVYDVLDDQRLELDVKKEPAYLTFDIPAEGYTLRPGELYLGVTQEYTETRTFVPFLEGKSSLGRLGLCIHATAGKGDVGFCGFWTLEMTVVRPLRIYAGMPVGQLIYFECEEVDVPYDKKPDAKYRRDTLTPVPVPSRMWRNFRTDADG